MSAGPLVQEQLLTIEEASRYLNVSKASLRRWANAGKLPCLRVGVRRERRFALSDVSKLLEPSSLLGSSEEVNAACTMEQHAPFAAGLSQVSASSPNHLCCHYTTHDEWWCSFAPYFREHINNESPIIYIYDTTTPFEFGERVRSEGYDASALMERGLLRLVPASEGYLRTGELPGSFSATGMISYLEALILEQRSRKYMRVLLSGELTWSLSNAPGSNELGVYELMLNDLLEKYPGLTAICHYDARRFDGKQTIDTLCSHDAVLLPGRVVSGYFCHA